MTINGIEYNLDLSPYAVEVEYGKIKIIYTFSSKLYVDKFMVYLNSKEILEKNKKLQRKLFGIGQNFRILYDLNKYKNLEKRGYLVYYNNKKITKSEDLEINFNIAIR